MRCACFRHNAKVVQEGSEANSHHLNDIWPAIPVAWYFIAVQYIVPLKHALLLKDRCLFMYHMTHQLLPSKLKPLGCHLAQSGHW